jgi:hypothetical protein
VTSERNGSPRGALVYAPIGPGRHRPAIGPDCSASPHAWKAEATLATSRASLAAPEGRARSSSLQSLCSQGCYSMRVRRCHAGTGIGLWQVQANRIEVSACPSGVDRSDTLLELIRGQPASEHVPSQLDDLLLPLCITHEFARRGDDWCH